MFHLKIYYQCAMFTVALYIFCVCYTFYYNLLIITRKSWPYNKPLSCLCFHRYIMIAHHSIYSRIYKKHWISCMIIFCWLFSYGFQLPTLFKVWGRFGFDEKLGTCSIVPDENGRSSKTALFFIAFITPCVIIIACYARIFWVVHE